MVRVALVDIANYGLPKPPPKPPTVQLNVPGEQPHMVSPHHPFIPQPDDVVVLPKGEKPEPVGYLAPDSEELARRKRLYRVCGDEPRPRQPWSVAAKDRLYWAFGIAATLGLVWVSLWLTGGGA